MIGIMYVSSPQAAQTLKIALPSLGKPVSADTLQHFISCYKIYVIFVDPCDLAHIVTTASIKLHRAWWKGTHTL